MKIISRPDFPKSVRVTCKYPKCRAVYEIEQGDYLKFMPDCRDRDYYEYACPVCNRANQIDSKLIPWERL